MDPIAKKMRDSIRAELFSAHACRDFWWRVVGVGDRRQQTLDVFNDYIGFFGMCVPLFFRSYVLATTALFDDHSESITLAALLREVQEDPCSDGTPIDEIANQIAEARVVARKLYRIRNKHLAHRSIQIFSRNFYAEAGLTYDEIRGLWDQCWSIFSSLSFHVDQSSESPLQDNLDALDRVIDALREEQP